jgi:hypothetical protein
MYFSYIFLILVAFSTLSAKSYSLSQDEVAKLKNNPSYLESSYQTHKQELILFLGEEFVDLSDDELLLVHAVIAAYCMAPYGTSNAIYLDDLLKSSYLNCGNYPILAVKLAEAARPHIANTLQVPFVAWRGKTMGGHGLLFLIRNDKKDLFLDPTFGVIARASFDEVAGGKPIPMNKIREFGFRGHTEPSKRHVVRVLKEGRLKPSELLYYYHSVDARNRSLPLDEKTATPRSQMELFGPAGYVKSRKYNDEIAPDF